MQALLTSGIASETTLAFLALDRALKICQSAWSLRIPKSGLVIVILWIYSFLVSCPPLFGWGEFVQEGPGIRYIKKWKRPHIHNIIEPFISAVALLTGNLHPGILCRISFSCLPWAFSLKFSLCWSHICASTLPFTRSAIYRAIFLITLILVWHDRPHQQKAIDNDIQ